MEARIRRAARPWAALAAVLFAAAGVDAIAAGYRTANFVVTAPTPELAKEIAASAENWRRALAIEWLGAELPRWSKPCPIRATVAPDLGAGGATSFVFDRGDVFGWNMEVQGSRERVLDSVLPHEITHTVFATHFRRPLPRWADEGACTTVEHRSEIAKQERLLIRFLKQRPSKGIPFDLMFAMKEYPEDVLPLYAQGHSLARFLIDQRGKHAFLEFLGDGMTDGNWPRAVEQHYGYEHLLGLQNSWLDWIRAGRPQIQPLGDAAIAANNRTTAPNVVGVSASVVAGSPPIAREAGSYPRELDAVPASWTSSQSQPPSEANPRATSGAARPVESTPDVVGAVQADWTTRPARYAAASPGGAAGVMK